MYTPYHYIYRHNNKPKEERPKWWFSMTIITLLSLHGLPSLVYSPSSNLPKSWLLQL